MPRQRASYSDQVLSHVPGPRPTRAVILARQSPERSAAEVAGSLEELRRLLEGLRISVAHTLVQKRSGREAILGKGKLQELAALLEKVQSTPAPTTALVVVDEELSPGQLRVLQKALDVEVADRTDIILRVFAERAGTRTAQLEVELAQLRYLAPRVRDDASLADREGGGGGRGERGHTNIELRKQRIREKVAQVERSLEAMRPHEEQRRVRRRELPMVALVGYTNAGKSSLMRGLTGSDVLVKDELFATLGTTVRALSPATVPRILVTDTVGFIKNLPHELISSFRSTLDEARDADLLLLVVDAADPQWPEQLSVTRSTIESLAEDPPPALVLLNKADRVAPELRERLAAEWPDALLMNAHHAPDLTRLRQRILGFFESRMQPDIFLVPASDGRLLADIWAHARVLEGASSAETTDGGDSDQRLRLRVRALPADLGRWRRQLPAPPIATPGDLLGRAREHGLDLSAKAGTTAELDGSGLDFQVLHAVDRDGVDWVLRTPRRPEVAQSACLESRVLALLRPRLPVAIPDWRLHTPDVIAYPRLPGTPAITFAPEMRWNNLDPAAPAERFLQSYAATVAALQSVPMDAARQTGIPIRNLERVRRTHQEAMVRTRDSLRPSPQLWERWQRWLADDSGWPDRLALVHGDLHPGHWLLADDGRLTGVLDWTEASVTDPSVDLALFLGAFGPGSLQRLLPLLEAAGGHTWPGLVHHCAERWAAFPALVADWAQRTDTPASLDFARTLLTAAEASTSPI